MTFEDLQELLAEQFSCDTSELERGVTLADLGADHEDMVELAWGLGEAVGTEIDESDLSVDFTIGELWRFVHDAEENAEPVTFTLPAANDKSLSLLKRTGSFVHVCVRV